MKHFTAFTITCMLVCLLACKSQQNDKSSEIVESKPVNDTITPQREDSLTVDSFTIVSLIPELAKDTSFHPVFGRSVGKDMQKITMYSIYSLPRKSLFAILNKNTKTMETDGRKNVSVYTDLVKQDTSFFFHTVYSSYESNPVAGKFYNKLRSLKDYDLYYGGTYGYMHWIFFDRNSDTVYHVTKLLTF